MNEQLKKLCEEDQGDLRDRTENRVERDRERRKRVKEILKEGGATEGIDFAHAAVIFQHGETLDDWWTAHTLAVKASELGFHRAKWLAAAALDRWLLKQGKPTKYGMQYVKLGGIYRVARFDPTTTDEERMKWDVPPISDYLTLSDAVRGMPDRKIVASSRVEELQVNAVRLSQHLAHSPTFEGEIVGHTKDNRPIYKNCQEWYWINKDDGNSPEIGWFLLPYSLEKRRTS